MSATLESTAWIEVCPLDVLQPGRGVCALVEGRPVAVFLVADELFAVDDVDPCSGASVLSRGLVGAVDVDGESVLYVASPLKKQRFDLRTGRCLDADGVTVQVHTVTEIDGLVLVAVPV
jgi:nitrite reductase (NADH) small subunit